MSVSQMQWVDSGWIYWLENLSALFAVWYSFNLEVESVKVFISGLGNLISYFVYKLHRRKFIHIFDFFGLLHRFEVLAY